MNIVAFKFSPCKPCCTNFNLCFFYCPLYIYHQVDASGNFSVSGDYAQYIGMVRDGYGGLSQQVLTDWSATGYQSEPPYYILFSDTMISGISPLSSIPRSTDITYDVYNITDFSLPIESGSYVCSGSGACITCPGALELVNLGVVAHRPNFLPDNLSGIFVRGQYVGPHPPLPLGGIETDVDDIYISNKLLFSPKDTRIARFDLKPECNSVVAGSIRVRDAVTSGMLFDSTAEFSYYTIPISGAGRTFNEAHNVATISGLYDLTKYYGELTYSDEIYEDVGVITGNSFIAGGLTPTNNSGLTVKYSGGFVLCGDGEFDLSLRLKPEWACCPYEPPFKCADSTIIVTALGVTVTVPISGGCGGTTPFWQAKVTTQAPIIPSSCMDNTYTLVSRMASDVTQLDKYVCSGIWSNTIWGNAGTTKTCARSGVGDAFFTVHQDCSSLVIAGYNVCNVANYDSSYFPPNTVLSKHGIEHGNPYTDPMGVYCSGLAQNAYPGYCCWDVHDNNFYGNTRIIQEIDATVVGEWKDYECLTHNGFAPPRLYTSISAGSGTQSKTYDVIYNDGSFMMASGAGGDIATINFL